MALEPIITVCGLSKQYKIGPDRRQPFNLGRMVRRELRSLPSNRSDQGICGKNEHFWALKDINFDVAKGDRVGIIGRNGAGKSTLLKILSRVTYPTEGEVRIRGRVTSLLEVGTGFNENLTGRENIFLNASLHGLTPKEIAAKSDDIVSFSGVERFIDTPLKHYSSGMRIRLGFSVAAHIEPDILILDEVLTVGDLAFQQKCLNRVQGLVSEGRTILFASHSMGDVARFCDRLIWIDHGSMKFYGDTLSGIDLYQNSVAVKGVGELRQRKDRTGTGTFRFTSIRYLDEDSNPCDSGQTGHELRIILEYEAQRSEEESPWDVYVCIVIQNEKQQRLFGLPSEVLRTNLTKISRNGNFVCRIHKLPLLPGVYEITASLLVNRQLVDKVACARTLPVLGGDFYGTGKLPHGYLGPLCVDFEWDHVAVDKGHESAVARPGQERENNKDRISQRTLMNTVSPLR